MVSTMTNVEKVQAILFKQAESCQSREEALHIIAQLKALHESTHPTTRS